MVHPLPTTGCCQIRNYPLLLVTGGGSVVCKDCPIQNKDWATEKILSREFIEDKDGNGHLKQDSLHASLPANMVCSLRCGRIGSVIGTQSSKSCDRGCADRVRT